MKQPAVDSAIRYLDTPKRAVLLTSEMWFPGGVLQEVEVLKLTETYALIRGTKRRLGFLWNVSKTFWVCKSYLEDIV